MSVQRNAVQFSYALSFLSKINLLETETNLRREEETKLMDLRSGSADSPRQVPLRLAKDGKWYLWEQYLLPDIRKPESENPWA